MNEDLKYEITKAFLRKDICTNSVNELITNDSDYNKLICRYEKAVQDIIQSDGNLFFIQEQTPGHESVGYKNKALFETIKLAVDTGKRQISRDINLSRNTISYHFNPYVVLLVQYTFSEPGDKIQNCLLSSSKYTAKETVDAFNEFVEIIKSKANDPEFIQKTRNYNRGLNKNYRSLVKYIDALFDKHSRLLVLRVDFAYSLTQKDLDQSHIHPLSKMMEHRYLQAKKDREHFFNNMRSNKNIFEHMLGHIWKLEYGRETGFHYHMFFFFDGSKVQQDINRAEMIGEYWNKTITVNRGRYYNCNANKESYKYLGIGMINHNDTELVNNLKKAAEYFTKADYYAKVFVKDKGRTLGKGELEPKSKKGRPRCSNKIQDTLHETNNF